MCLESQLQTDRDRKTVGAPWPASLHYLMEWLSKRPQLKKQGLCGECWEMVQSVKCLLYKKEHLNSDLQHSYRANIQYTKTYKYLKLLLYPIIIPNFKGLKSIPNNGEGCEGIRIQYCWSEYKPFWKIAQLYTL